MNEIPREFVKDLHNKLRKAYNLTYERLTIGNSHDQIEDAVRRYEKLTSPPEGVPPDLFNAIRTIGVLSTLIDRIDVIFRTRGDDITMVEAMILIGKAFDAGVLLGAAYVGKRERQVAEKYEPFNNACKKSKKDPLRRALEDIVDSHLHSDGKLPSFNEVVDKLRRSPIVQEVDEDGEVVEWKGNGKERITSFKSIKNRLIIIKKELQENLKIPLPG